MGEATASDVDVFLRCDASVLIQKAPFAYESFHSVELFMIRIEIYTHSLCFGTKKPEETFELFRGRIKCISEMII